MTKAYSRKEDPKRGALMGAFAIGSDKAINCLVLRCQNYGGRMCYVLFLSEMCVVTSLIILCKQ